jgi:Zn-dependent protease
MIAASLLDRLLLLLILVLSIALHEFGHAAMSTKLGDPTPRLQGRLTLNPVAHFDLYGFIFLAMMAFFGFGFAWGRPVQTNPLYYKEYRKGIVLTAIAGPAMNLCLAMLWIGLGYVMFTGNAPLNDAGHRFLAMWVTTNVFLMVFNMLPIPPLDGGHLLQQLSPAFMAPFVSFMQGFGMLVLLGLLFTGVFGVIVNIAYRILIIVVQGAFGANYAWYLFGGG